MEKTLIILKPSAVQRGLIGEVTQKFEKRPVCGMKMMQLEDEILNEHYAHLATCRFFTHQRLYDGFSGGCLLLARERCREVVRSMTGVTNGREALRHYPVITA